MQNISYAQAWNMPETGDDDYDNKYQQQQNNNSTLSI